MGAEAVEIRTDLPGGRRELRLEIGPYDVAVAEIPGGSLAAHEWHDVQLARCSYLAMWGGASADLIADDPTDGLGSSSPYDTRHYLAWVRERDGHAGGKLVTMRKVRLAASRLSAALVADPSPLLPVDIQLWRVDTDGRCVPLWQALCDHFALGDEEAAVAFATIGRTGTYPYGQPEPTVVARERTAVGFAAIQLLAAEGDPGILWICSLCPEFQDRVLGVRDVDGRHVAPVFTRTEDALGLPAGPVALDNELTVVRQHKIGAPGYFVDNEDAADVLNALLDDGSITVADLGPSMGRLIEAESAIGGAGRRLEELLASRDHRRLAETLTRPRLFKYLGPLLAGMDPLARMPLADLRTRLLFETRDGPFSAAMRPISWAEDARRVLLAVEGKYPRRCR
jgi:hypothetical protein